MARRGNLLEELAGEIVAAGGTKPVLIVEDLMTEGSPARIAKAALEGLGSVDILINNAGGSRAFKLDATEEQWHEAMTLNFTRQRQLTHALLDQMMARKWGRIVNITGKSEPEGLNGAFCAKAAVHAWAKGLSREVGKHGITVNSIPPGRIHSEQIRRNYTPEYRQVAGRQRDPRRPLRRAGGRGRPGVLPGLAAGRLHHRHRHPGRWRAAAVSVLIGAPTLANMVARDLKVVSPGSERQLNSHGGRRVVRELRVQALVVGPEVDEGPERAVDRGDEAGLGGDCPQLRGCDRSFDLAGKKHRGASPKSLSACQDNIFSIIVASSSKRRSNDADDRSGEVSAKQGPRTLRDLEAKASGAAAARCHRTGAICASKNAFASSAALAEEEAAARRARVMTMEETTFMTKLPVMIYWIAPETSLGRGCDPCLAALSAT